MFGYIRPDTPYMYIKDKTLYQAMYCGLCKSIGKTCGNCARMGLSYDVTFLSLILHNIKGLDISIKKEHCLLHWFTKKPVAQPDELSLTIGALNTFMVYYKLTDDILDGDGGKTLRGFFKRGFKRAKKQYPQLEEIVRRKTIELSKKEKENLSSIDIVADSFASMMQEISQTILKDKSNAFTEKLFYNLGKWVYLIDAIDDYDEDIKKKRYNVFYNLFKKENKVELLKDNKDIDYVFRGIFFDLADSLKNIEFAFNSDLIQNVILRGLPRSTENVFKTDDSKMEELKFK